MSIDRRAYMAPDLRTCREHAWVDTEGRHDTVFTVYVNDKQGSDLLLLCETYLKLRNGNEVTTDFVAGVQIDGPETAAPRLRTYWTLWVGRLILTCQYEKAKILVGLCAPANCFARILIAVTRLKVWVELIDNEKTRQYPISA